MKKTPDARKRDLHGSEPPDRSPEALALENRVLKKALDDMMEGLYITDADEKIMWINDIAVKTDGQDRGAIIGRSEAEVYADIGRYHHFTTRTGKAVPMGRTHFHLPDGQETEMLRTTKPFFEDGRLKAVYTIGYLRQTVKYFARLAVVFDDGHSEKKPQPNHTRFTFDDIIGKSREMTHLVKIAKKAALSEANIMIHGRTGTGKELVAQSIHNASRRVRGPFIDVNCAAIPDTLLESLLFGTAKGAFTGASDSPGLFELANGGTLFLDEVNSMPMELQPKLLRALQTKEIRRLGDKRLRPIDCRIISASNLDPLAEVRNNRLRDDIYFRLAVIVIPIPPLQDRQEDIEPLFRHFVKQLKPDLLKNRRLIDPGLLELMKAHNWPGNVRELEHVVEYMVAMMDQDAERMDASTLPPSLAESLTSHPVSPAANPAPPEIYPGEPEDSEPFLVDALRDYERQLIEKALKRTGGNITNAARNLGLSRQTFSYRAKRLGLDLSPVDSPDLDE